MKITLNGESKEIPVAISIMQLLEQLGFEPTRVAVERNLEVAPRDKYAEIIIGADDQIEIVHFIGGG